MTRFRENAGHDLEAAIVNSTANGRAHRRVLGGDGDAVDARGCSLSHDGLRSIAYGMASESSCSPPAVRLRPHFRAAADPRPTH